MADEVNDRSMKSRRYLVEQLQQQLQKDEEEIERLKADHYFAPREVKELRDEIVELKTKIEAAERNCSKLKICGCLSHNEFLRHIAQLEEKLREAVSLLPEHSKACVFANTDEYDGTDIDTPYRCICKEAKLKAFIATLPKIG